MVTLSRNLRTKQEYIVDSDSLQLFELYIAKYFERKY